MKPSSIGLRAAIGLVLASLAGCGAMKPAVDGAAGTSSNGSAAQVWQYPASEFPTMCLVLEPGGNARFVGGFLYFNPSSWRRDDAGGLTVLTVGGGQLPMPPAPPAASAAKTAVVRVDEGRRSIHYRIEPQTASIDFGGFIFYRTPRCTAP